MSAPAVRRLKRGRPDVRLTVLTRAKLADFWRLVPEVDELITIEPGDSVFRVASKIRRDFEVAILFPNSSEVRSKSGWPEYRAGWVTLGHGGIIF